MSEQELKDLQVKLEEKAKVLEEKLNATTDPEEKQKLKQTLDNVYKKRQVVMTELGLAPKEEAKGDKQMDKEKLKELMVKLDEKEKALKDLYSSADTPEKKEKIKQDLDMFYKKRQALLTQYGIAKMKQDAEQGRAGKEAAEGPGNTPEAQASDRRGKGPGKGQGTQNEIREARRDRGKTEDQARRELPQTPLEEIHHVRGGFLKTAPHNPFLLFLLMRLPDETLRPRGCRPEIGIKYSLNNIRIMLPISLIRSIK